MLRVLQKTATLGPGGIQRFLINIQSNMDANKVRYDYYLNTLEPNFFTEKALDLGSRIYGPKENKGNIIKRFFSRYCLFYKTIKKNKYNIVHIDETLLMTAVSVVVSKLAGAKVIIAHSHNDHSAEKKPWFMEKIINPLARNIISAFSTDYFACSKMAAKWFFTEKVINSGKVKIINNGIESELYTYNPESERKVREELNIGNAFVLGHIGRFFKQKNHRFILEVFKELKKLEENSVLLLIGEGELKQDIMQYAVELGIYDSVIFYGLSNHVNKLLHAFNAFVFPSEFEGLGIVAVEAQAASVQTFCAKETIPAEVNITEYCNYISLKKSAREWADEILKKSKTYTKKNTIQKIKDANFDVQTVAKYLENFYLKRGN